MDYDLLLFLDIDGVLKCPNGDEYHDANGQPFEYNDRDDFFVELSKTWNPEAIKQFHRLLDLYPDLKIVVSSSQRHSYSQDTIKNLFRYYPKIQERIVGRTISLTYGNRGDEIQSFLDNHKVNKFVIIDDDDDMGHLLPRLVKTEFRQGFSSLDLVKVKNLLS